MLKATNEAGTQVSAWFALLLDSGMRKSEALGLQWNDIDLDAGTCIVAKQLDSEYPVTFGVTKTDRSRVVTLSAETTTKLRAHRKAQRELMMHNRDHHRDHGLVFAKQLENLLTPHAELGTPCVALTKRYHAQIVKALVCDRSLRTACATRAPRCHSALGYPCTKSRTVLAMRRSR